MGLYQDPASILEVSCSATVPRGVEAGVQFQMLQWVQIFEHDLQPKQILFSK